jgi:glycerol transport system substrate-binding protein
VDLPEIDSGRAAGRRLAQLWWENIAPAASGEISAQEAMDDLAAAQDEVLGRLERAGSDSE